MKWLNIWRQIISIFDKNLIVIIIKRYIVMTLYYIIKYIRFIKDCNDATMKIEKITTKKNIKKVKMNC